MPLKMDMSRVGGFAPSQWVLGRLPRRGAGFQGDDEGFADVGSMQARIDGVTEFAKRADYRECAKKAFVHHDSSVRVQKAMLRKAAPLPGEYKVGDVVAFQREQGAVTEDDRWNPGSRIIGFDGEGGKTHGEAGETQNAINLACIFICVNSMTNRKTLSFLNQMGVLPLSFNIDFLTL